VTPAIEAARRAGIPVTVYEYAHDPGQRNFGREAANALGLDPRQVFKTLLVTRNGDPRRLSVAVVPVSGQLDLKAMAVACASKRVEMADAQLAERSTGYVVGGISPLGQRRRLPTVIDASATQFDTVFVSGGRRGLDLGIAPADLIGLCDAVVAPVGK
jgi:Cys-tRNA(Pro)/Cys-tRNA(Cys) deacylase